MSWTILTNDLILQIPFSLILWRAAAANAGSRKSSS